MQTLKTRKKISVALLGKKFSKQRKQNISISLMGRHLSKKHKVSISLGNIGRNVSMKTRKLISTKLLGNKNFKRTFGSYHPNWVNVPKKYSTIHWRVKRKFGKANKCESLHCSGKSKVYHWSNKDHKYGLKRKEWQKLCVACHMLYDENNGFRKRGKNGKFLYSKQKI